MHIVFDAREAFRDRKTGKGQWAMGLLSALRKRGVAITLLTDAPINAKNSVVLPAGMRWHFAAARYLRSHAKQCDIYLSPTSFIVPFLVRASVPCACVIHDLIAFRGEPHDRKATCIERLLLPRIVRSVRTFLCVSESTKHDLLERFPALDPSRVSVVYAGPRVPHVPLSQPDERTILCIATLCPRKNQLSLMRAFAALPSPLREQYRLLLAGGRGWQDDEIVSMARNTKGVEWIGYVSEKEYDALLSTSTVFALPSLYEGFGMQILDALQRGVPVLTSDRGSLREVAGDAALLVDPSREQSIESGLIAILENKDVRDVLRAKGSLQAARFSWERTADLVLKSLEAAVYSDHASV